MRIIELPFRVKRPILACGADLKGAFALASGNKAYLVDGFGDLGDADNFDKYTKAVKAYERRLRIKPAIVACDLHPDYFSTGFANDYKLYAKRYTLHKIQHHEAHIASAITAGPIKGPVIGVAFDGTGFGSDGNIWGGEFFVGNPLMKSRPLERVGRLEYVAMPGGESAIKEPWKIAASYLYHAFGNKFLALKTEFVERLDKDKWRVLKRMIDKRINSPLTSSAGRFFDAVSSIVLLKYAASFEAELPIELERLAAPLSNETYGFEIKKKGCLSIVCVAKAIKGIIGDLAAGEDKRRIAARFHNTMAHIILKACNRLRARFKIDNVILSGGVFQNRYLSRKARAILERGNFRVYMPSRLPVNDSAIPIGQIMIANMRM